MRVILANCSLQAITVAVSFCHCIVDSGQMPLSQLFQKSSDTWECPTCMITNKNVDTICAACSSPKPTTGGDASEVGVYVLLTVTSIKWYYRHQSI